MSIKQILENILHKKLQTGGAGYYNNGYNFSSQFNFLPSYILPEVGQILLDTNADFKGNKKSGEQIRKEEKDKLFGLGVTSAAGLLSTIGNVNYYQNSLQRQKQLDIPNYTPVPSDGRYNSSVTDNYQQYEAGGQIPDRYKEMGFTHVGQEKKSTRDGKKWMVLAKKGDKYKVVHGGAVGMEDYSQHHDKERRKRFWDRMGGKDSAQANDPFSPLYYHKRRGYWSVGGLVDEVNNQQLYDIKNYNQVGGVMPKDILGYSQNSSFQNEPFIDIHSSNISMHQTNKVLKGIADTGEEKIMYPGNDYHFKGASVVREVPLNQVGGILNQVNSQQLFDYKNYYQSGGSKTASLPIQNKWDIKGDEVPTALDDILYYAGKAKEISPRPSGAIGLQTFGKVLKPITSALYLKDKNYLKAGTNFVPFLNEGLDYLIPGWDSNQANQGIGNSFSKIPEAMTFLKNKVSGMIGYQSGGKYQNYNYKYQVGDEVEEKTPYSGYENIDEDKTGQYNYLDYSDDSKQQEQESDDFWKDVDNENNLMFTVSEDVKEQLRNRSRDKEINLNIPETFSNGQRGESTAIRNNSPLNQKFSPFMASLGATRGRPAKEGDGSYEAHFETVSQGLNAAKALWQTPAYLNNTVKGSLKRWSDGTYDPKIYSELADIVNKPVKQLSPQEFDRLIKTQVKFEDSQMHKKLYGYQVGGANNSVYSILNKINS